MPPTTLTELLANTQEREKLEQRLWIKVEKSPDSHCWLWTGGKQKDGYGVIKVGGKALRVHRVVYEIYFGEIPDNQSIRHRCDRPSCCNPKHLKLGDNQENVTDRVLRDRSAKGSMSGLSKLTELGVEKIIRELQQGATVANLAVQHEVSRQAIYDISRGKNWAHILPDINRPIKARCAKSPKVKAKAKLSVEQVREIRDRHNRGGRQVDLAREFKLSPSTLSDLINMRTWADVN